MTLAERKKAALDVLGYFGEEGGWETGGFTSDLIKAITHADQHNQFLIHQVYPELVDAVVLYQTHDNGKWELQQWAKA